MIRATLLLLSTLSLLAQAQPKPTPTPKLPTEASTIERFRRHAKPRQIAPEAALGTDERNTIRRFWDTKPSVVHVSAILRGGATPNLDTTRVPTGSGTGIVWDAWGHIVTNHHVITVEENGKRLTDVSEVEVTLSNGKVYKGRVIGFSFAYDIAVLQVFAPLDALRPIRLGQSSKLQVGQSVLAIGNPFGLDHSLTKGVLSSLGREIDTGYGTQILSALQTDAAVNPGNSGGPLLDSGGRLIGMNTAIAAATGASVGIGFAIPVDTLNRVVPQLIAKGDLQPARMGFDILNAGVALKTLGVQRGLVVWSVEPDSPAGRAGLVPLQQDASGQVTKVGDILLAYQGRPLESNGHLAALLEVEPPQDEVVFDVLREGRVIKVVLNLKPVGTRPLAL